MKRNTPCASASANNSEFHDSKDTDKDTASVSSNDFLYVHVQFPNSNVSALLDSGSSINLMSKQFYESLPSNVKSTLSPLPGDKIILANNQEIHICGLAQIQATVNKAKHNIDVYVIKETSHPLLLGVQYLKQHGIKLDFSSKTVQFTKCKIYTKKRTTLAPNSETIVWGRVPKNICTGFQGICSGSTYVSKKKLLVARSLGVVSTTSLVPIKILNPTSESVLLHRSKPLGEFQILDHTFDIHQSDDILGTASENTPYTAGQKFQCSHVSSKSGNTKSAHNSEFLSLFEINSDLSSQQKQNVEKLLIENKALFVTPDNPDLGLTDLVEHKIHLKPGMTPKHQRPYKLAPDKREVLRHQLDELLRQGIIAPVSEKEDIPISSPIVLVSKRNKPKPGIKPGSPEASLSMYRFCVDFRYLNSQTQEFCYAIPDVHELTESFSHRTPNFISSIDMSSGFFQMKMSRSSTKFTAFNTCYGTFKFSRLPMGLKTSPNSFQLLMDRVLNGLSFRSTLCYLDDVLIFSETFEQHMQDLQEVFSRFSQAGLKLSPQKCKFAQQKCLFLGSEISSAGIHVPEDRLTAVSEYPKPKNAKALKRYLGLMNWFKKFIPNYSAVANPLYQLLRKDVKFSWQEEHQNAFQKLKDLLLSSEALAFPRYDLQFYLAVDSSSKGIGYVLYQKHPKPEGEGHTDRVVRFGSKSLSKWQSSYGPTKLELLGMVTSIIDCASYVRGRKFILECDHQSLKPLFQKSLKGAIYERWLAILQQFNFEIKYKKCEDMVVPDALSRCNIQEDPSFSSPEEKDPFFPFVLEHTGEITFPNGCTLQQLLQTNKVSLQQESDLILTHDTSYDADTDMTEAPPITQGQTKRRLKRGKHKKQHLPPQISTVSVETDQTVSDSTDISTSTEADSSQSSFLEDNVKKLELFTKFDFSADKTKDLQRHDPELHRLISYLDSNILPRSQKQARRILLESNDYVLIDGLLWHSRVQKAKRTKQLDQYQLVLPDTMIKTVIQLYHNTPMSGHAGIADTIDRIKEHYFFQRMGPIITDYVRSCPDCQQRKQTKVHTKSGVTAYQQPGRPFEVWQIDLYGNLPATTGQGYTYVLTCLDMFSRYLVTIPIANKDTLTVASALTQLFTKYGVCKTLISDLGSEFTSKCMKEICRQLHIQQEFTPAFAHHCLGMCERVHKTLAERLTPYVNS